VPDASPRSLNATTLGDVIVTIVELPALARRTSNLVSLLELSCQVISIWLSEMAVAFVFDGADS